MAKYIDQSVAIARLTHLEVTKPTATMTDAKRALADMFPADVVPVVHGRWLSHYRSGVTVAAGFVSSCCDMWAERWSNYCPHCGAKMDL